MTYTSAYLYVFGTLTGGFLAGIWSLWHKRVQEYTKLTQKQEVPASVDNSKLYDN